MVIAGAVRALKIGVHRRSRTHRSGFARELEDWSSRLRLVAMVLALVGLASGIGAGELFYEGAGEGTAYMALKVVTTATTAVLILTIALKYATTFALMRERQALLSQATFIDSGLLLPLLGELVACAFHCPVGVGGSFVIRNLRMTLTYDWDSLLSIVLFVRLYLVLYVIDDMLGYRSQHARVIARWNGVTFGPSVTFRAFMDKWPIRTVGTIFTVGIIICAHALRVTERPLCRSPEAIAVGWCGDSTLGTKDFSNFTVCLWATFITGLTIGYGDVYAVTHLGRMSSVFIALFGVVSVALLLNAVSKSVQLANDEVRALGALAEHNLAIKRRARAARLLSAFIGFTVATFKARRKGAAAITSGAKTGATRPGRPIGAAAPQRGNDSITNPLQGGTRPVGDFEASLQSGRAGEAPLQSMFRKVLPLSVTRELVAASVSWKHTSIRWAELHRFKDANSLMQRDILCVRSTLEELKSRVEGMSPSAGSGLFGAPAPDSDDAGPTLQTVMASLVAAVAQLNTLAAAESGRTAIGAAGGAARPLLQPAVQRRSGSAARPATVAAPVQPRAPPKPGPRW